MQKWAQKQTGFTIVELLIVIVVIAILAAITIVAYNGIQNRARDSALQSAASQAAKRVASHKTLNADTLPTLLEDAGVRDSGDTQYTYLQVSSTKEYCVSAASVANASRSFAYSSEAGSVTSGTCVTNRVTNPGVETGTTGWGLSVNSSTASRSTTAALIGSYGLLVTTSSTADSGVSFPVSGSFVAGNTYTASVKIKALNAANYSLSVQGTAGAPSRHNQALAANEEGTFRLTWTAPATGSAVFYALRQGGQSGTATFYVDGAVLVDGAAGYMYGPDGDKGWLWTGAAHGSASIGPALTL